MTLILFIIPVLILVTLLFILMKLAFVFNKLGDVYDMQIKFNNIERAYANKVERINRDYTEQIRELQKEIEIKNEFVDKIYDRQSQLEKYLRNRTK